MRGMASFLSEKDELFRERRNLRISEGSDVLGSTSRA
jgi:hypothetical protein